MVFKKLFSVFRKKDDITITETKPEAKAEIASTEDEMNAHEQLQAKEETSALALNESLSPVNDSVLSPNEPDDTSIPNKPQQALAIQLFDPTQKRPAAITPSGTIITHSPFDPEVGEKPKTEIPKFDKQPADEKELWDAVNKVIDARIRPMIQSHQGEIELVKIENSVVTVRLTGTCVGCAMSTVTLKYGVKKDITSALPQIKDVEAVFAY